MRQLLVLAAAVPLALGCAQQSSAHRSAVPEDGSLQVRLFPPSADRPSLAYVLSEPAYVAVFTVTRGRGTRLVFPYSLDQIEQPRGRGINQVSTHRTGGTSYYIIASRYPLPIEGMLRSKALLRQLLGEQAFHAVKLSDTWSALNAVMVAKHPDRAWASSSLTYVSGNASRGAVVRCTGGRVPARGGCWRPPASR